MIIDYRPTWKISAIADAFVVRHCAAREADGGKRMAREKEKKNL
jgi:hypothetical protein